MQRTESISKERVERLVKLAFEIGIVRFFESYSEMDEEIVEIVDFENYLKYYDNSIRNGKKALGFGLYYKEAKGHFNIRKIRLKPKYCNGKTFRYCIEGWGIIFIDLDLRSEEIECRVSVNSEKRAQNWMNTMPRMKSPDLWDWKMVESKARKLIRELKKEK